MAEIQYYGTGRRKTAVARVYLRPGKGDIVVNRRTFDEYFPNRVLKMIIRQPMMLTETNDKFDILVNVVGGLVADIVEVEHPPHHRAPHLVDHLPGFGQGEEALVGDATHDGELPQIPVH